MKKRMDIENVGSV